MGQLDLVNYVSVHFTKYGTTQWDIAYFKTEFLSCFLSHRNLVSCWVLCCQLYVFSLHHTCEVLFRSVQTIHVYFLKPPLFVHEHTDMMRCPSIVMLLYGFQTMVEMNKVMDPQKTMQTMQEFEKQSTKMAMSEEMSKFQAVYKQV